VKTPRIPPTAETVRKLRESTHGQWVDYQTPECPLDSKREVEGPVLRRSYLLPEGHRARVEEIGHSL
jgi:hypothetical protein